MSGGPHGHLPEPGALFGGKYRIGRLLGQGGVGAVFLANHEILQQPVAIKVLLPELSQNPAVVHRFLNEARASARLKNEHVASVMDVGTADDGTAFMVLEYLDGLDMAEVVNQRGALPVEEVVDYVLQALEAIAHAHAIGIVHRDLKPANLFLARRQDGSEMVKVLDFGISKNTEMTDASVTTTRTTLGSPGYMAPEQVRSAKNVDPRADIWSIGVILYKLLTSKSPFEGGDIGAVFASILEDEPPSLRKLREDIPADLEAVVFRCLRKQRDERFQNAGELARALAPFGPVEAGPTVDRILRVVNAGAMRDRSPSATVLDPPRVAFEPTVLLGDDPRRGVSPVANTVASPLPPRPTGKGGTVLLGDSVALGGRPPVGADGLRAPRRAAPEGVPEVPTTKELRYAPAVPDPAAFLGPKSEAVKIAPPTRPASIPPPPRSRGPLYVAIGALALALAGGAFVLTRSLVSARPAPSIPTASTPSLPAIPAPPAASPIAVATSEPTAPSASAPAPPPSAAPAASPPPKSVVAPPPRPRPPPPGDDVLKSGRY